MQVAPALDEINVNLITDVELMTAIARVDGRGVGFVTITEHDAMETATDQHCHGIGGTVACAEVHGLLLIGIDQAPRHIAPPGHAVSAEKHR